MHARLADVAALLPCRRSRARHSPPQACGTTCRPTTSRTRASWSSLRPILVPPPRAGLSAEHQGLVAVFAVPASAVPHGCGLVVRVARPQVVGESDFPHLAVVHAFAAAFNVIHCVHGARTYSARSPYTWTYIPLTVWPLFHSQSFI